MLVLMNNARLGSFACKPPICIDGECSAGTATGLGGGGNPCHHVPVDHGNTLTLSSQVSS